MKMQAQYKTILILGSLVAFLSLQVLKAETSCCGDAQYDSSVEDCCGGVVVPIGHCCSGQEFDPETEECCGGFIVEKGRCCNGEQLQESEYCCNDQPYSDPWVCCNDTAINPTTKTTLSKSLDFSAIGNAIREVSSTVLSVTGAGCAPQMSGPVTLSVEWETHKECCSNEITKLSSISGSANIQSAAITCQATPTVAILPPQVAGIRFIVTLGLSASFSLTGEQTCENTDVCTSIRPAGSLTGNVEGYVGMDGYEVVTITGGATGRVTGSMKYCVESGANIESLCFEPSLHASIKMAGIWEVIAWNHTFSSACL